MEQLSLCCPTIGAVLPNYRGCALELQLLLSRFSRVRLCATPETAAHQAPLPWDSPGRDEKDTLIWLTGLQSNYLNVFWIILLLVCRNIVTAAYLHGKGWLKTKSSNPSSEFRKIKLKSKELLLCNFCFISIYGNSFPSVWIHFSDCALFANVILH